MCVTVFAFFTYLLTYIRIYRDMMLDSTVVNVACRRALRCEWGGGGTGLYLRPSLQRRPRCGRRACVCGARHSSMV